MQVPAGFDFLVYADGSCIGNPGPGGWGVVIVRPAGSESEHHGSNPATTNNQMEITAAIEGLKRTTPGSRVILRSDSQYVINTMTLNWKRRKNHELWAALDAEAARRKVTFQWVRGHDTDELNQRADRLANLGSRRASG
ncbi:MAG TPA: ribonuclease H [Candidatus Binataceae bacterium]|nr:ribonuclease H [Candidatus Binataceae bacterium]